MQNLSAEFAIDEATNLPDLRVVSASRVSNISDRVHSGVMNYIHLTQTLVESFNALADEVQSLTDRKTVLEHKLRFAHEQFQYLADKHAPAAPEISETLAKLQIPLELTQPSAKSVNTVPLPKRGVADASHQIALLIRDGRRVAHQLASIAEPSKTSLSSRETYSRLSNTATSMSTAALEQDFTVEGKKGSLACPFSASPEKNAEEAGNGAAQGAAPDPTPHQSTDPICAAMFEEATSQPASAANKCPIRFLDKHSPEEIAHYVKTHGHELPRSHAVCVERYQRNEDQIRKLDAKYGNMVSMIEGLSQLHKPMLPVSEEHEPDEVDRDVSNQRVENWAQDVSANAAEFSAPPALSSRNEGSETQHGDVIAEDHERESHFDRPLKEVRVGESPSRPWGISVPIYEPNEHGHSSAPLSPPPAPVLMPSQASNMVHPVTPEKRTGKCPFDHTKLAAMGGGLGLMQRPQADDKTSEASHKPPTERPFMPQKQTQHTTRPAAPVQPLAQQQPAFLNPLQPTKAANGQPQMVFTGPVFIGYPTDQAIQFMQAFQAQQP
ncbi:hypothetical protein jhhlp_001328 [Lomentospora prolificans]|uniref:Uncharacterized protein n=1 Tax=Lomentospora prolificans TaxID=41688 RepID=A0A2N3NI52_9PEZI|nr:hypothetical protein jhhlp_001328 [Lomentospora prolificans]